jgi:hypothetical protein
VYRELDRWADEQLGITNAPDHAQSEEEGQEEKGIKALAVRATAFNVPDTLNT